MNKTSRFHISFTSPLPRQINGKATQIGKRHWTLFIPEIFSLFLLRKATNLKQCHIASGCSFWTSLTTTVPLQLASFTWPGREMSRIMFEVADMMRESNDMKLNDGIEWHNKCWEVKKVFWTWKIKCLNLTGIVRKLQQANTLDMRSVWEHVYWL